jgi:hypothetical protein
MKKLLTLLLLAIALSASAAEPKKPADFKGAATMCNGTYALCIKAPCLKERDANNLFPCECVLQTGWNMGPNSCDERDQKLTSTYSNNFNDGSRTVSCAAPTDWAWCYGAMCAPDPKDPTKLAICKCPVITSDTVILMKQDRCPDKSSICRMLWSGALPTESKFANAYYAWWMTSHGYETEPPAKACPVPPSN